MGIILVDGHNYNKLTTVFHSPAEQGWVHEQFRDFYKDVKETGYLPHTLLADYCRESYKLHPHRFAKYHPWLSKEIAKEIQHSQQCYVPHLQQCYVPPMGVSPCSSTPEPTSLILGSIALILLVLWRKFQWTV